MSVRCSSESDTNRQRKHRRMRHVLMNEGLLQEIAGRKKIQTYGEPQNRNRIPEICCVGYSRR